MIVSRTLLFPVILLAWMESSAAQDVLRISSDKAVFSSSDWIGQITDLTYVDSLIYAAEAGAGQVHVFDDQLTHLFSFGKPGRGPGDLARPVYIREIEGNIYISETGELRFSIFDKEGNFIRNILKPKKPNSLAFLDHSSYISTDIWSDHLFYIMDMEEGRIRSEFGQRYNPNNTSNGNELFVRNRYFFQPVDRDKILIVNRASGDFSFIYLHDKPEVSKVPAEIRTSLYRDRSDYVDTYLNTTSMQQLSYPTFIDDLQVCHEGEFIYVSYGGQDGERHVPGLLLQLSFNTGEKLTESQNYLFEDRNFGRFAVSDDCRFIFFYDLREGKVVKYSLEE